MVKTKLKPGAKINLKPSTKKKQPKIRVRRKKSVKAKKTTKLYPNFLFEGQMDKLPVWEEPTNPNELVHGDRIALANGDEGKFLELCTSRNGYMYVEYYADSYRTAYVEAVLKLGD